MPGWLADFFRFWWGLLYWNVSKTVFRWRGGRCPCQNPSDSGHARETACEACHSWHQPARFQRVCPLLVTTPNGLRCSANTADVRPFWGRAAGFYGGALAAIYLTAAVGAFALLRCIGYPVSFKAVAWPLAWSEIRVAQSDYFYKKACRALAASQTKEAALAYSNAYELNPRNYQAGMVLAQLWQTGLPVWSDRIYTRLLHDDTAQAASIAEQWYRAMLARGDFSEIAKTVPDFLTRDPADTSVWIHAIFFAAHRLGDDKPLRKMLDENHGLGPDLRRLVEIQLLIETGRAADAHRALLGLPVNAFYPAFYQISKLTALGFPDEALLALDHNARFLPAQYNFILHLDAFSAQGWPSLVHNEIELILSAPANAPAIEQLCAYFIRHPDAKFLGALFDKLQQEPLPPTTDSYKAALALFCAAGANADWPRLKIARTMLRRLSGNSFPALDLVESFFHSPSDQHRLENVLPILQPMSLDVTYSLFEHYGSNPRHPAP